MTLFTPTLYLKMYPITQERSEPSLARSVLRFHDADGFCTEAALANRGPFLGGMIIACLTFGLPAAQLGVPGFTKTSQVPDRFSIDLRYPDFRR